jgi:L-malate glycosyltransferase
VVARALAGAAGAALRAGGAGPFRVGLLGPLADAATGGAAAQAERLASHLAATGCEVVAASRHASAAGRALDIATAPWRWRRSVDVLVVLVLSGRAFLWADAATRAAAARRIPVVLWLHGGGLPDFARRHPAWVAAVLERARLRVAPSRYLGGLATDGQRWLVIPNALPLEDYPFRPRAPQQGRLLWMRTFHPAYRPELALDVLRRVMETQPRATLTMAGPDEGVRRQVERQAREMGLAHAVHFPGILRGAAKAAALADHDVLLNTNRVDSQPTTLLEAAASGLPIVSTSVGGIPDLVRDREEALLPTADDPQALAAAVVELLTHPELAADLTRKARRLAERFSWQEIGTRWRQALAEVR